MKIIQTTITDAEYRLLEDYAKTNGKSIGAVVHEAIRATIECIVNPNDPIFTFRPSAKRSEETDSGSIDHDESLYGKE